MQYIFVIFMAACGFHTLTYGVHLIKKKHNRLGGVSVILLAVFGTAVPAAMLIIKA